MAKIFYEGKEVEATEITVVNEDEPWNTYDLNDGTKIKTKSVLAQVYRIEELYDSIGRPIYLFTKQTITSITSPDGLRKKR